MSPKISAVTNSDGSISRTTAIAAERFSSASSGDTTTPYQTRTPVHNPRFDVFLLFRCRAPSELGFEGEAGRLDAVARTDTDTTVKYVVDDNPTGGGIYLSVIGRHITTTNDYRARVRLLANGEVDLQLFSNVSGTLTTLDSVTVAGLTYTANDVIYVRVQVTGTNPTTIRAKTWVDGTPEPSTWTLEHTDTTTTLQTPGTVGFEIYVSGSATNTPTTLTIDDLVVTDPTITPPAGTSQTTNFVWTQTGGLPVLLQQDTGTGPTQIIYGPGHMPLAEITDTTVAWYHHDQLGSTRLVTNNTGNPTGTYTYTAYGQLAASTGTHDPLLDYASQYTDNETGFQHLRARYYDPTTTQFLTRDPLVSETHEPYAYAGDNPANFSDPSGLDRCYKDGDGRWTCGDDAFVTGLLGIGFDGDLSALSNCVSVAAAGGNATECFQFVLLQVVTSPISLGVEALFTPLNWLIAADGPIRIPKQGNFGPTYMVPTGDSRSVAELQCDVEARAYRLRRFSWPTNDRGVPLVGAFPLPTK